MSLNVDRMKINIRGRGLRVTEALRRHVEEQLDRLSRHYDRILEAHVTLRAERELRIVDVTLHLPQHLMKAEERSKSLDEAIDLVRGRLEHQLQKYKTRTLGKRHKGDGKIRTPQTARAISGTSIVRTKRFALLPMTAPEAAAQMELLGHDFHMFLNAETGQVNVLYRRKAGGLGLIEPVM